MALSGKTSTKHTGTSSYGVWVEWSATQSISGNYSDVTAELWMKTNSYGYIPYPAGDSAYIEIAGSRTNLSGLPELGRSTTKRIGRASKRVNHGSNGRKSLTIKGQYKKSGSTSFTLTPSRKITLNTIPRESTITSFNFSDIRPRQFKINYKVDKSVDRVRYRLDGGSWTTLPSNGIVKVDNQNHNYRVQLEVRNTQSGLPSTSNTKTVRTIQISTSEINTFSTSNPEIEINTKRESDDLYHNVELQVKNDSGGWVKFADRDVEYKQVFNLTNSELDNIYKAVTKSKQAEWRAVTVTRWKSFTGENQGSRNSTSKTININDAPPYIDSVSYKDINSDIQNILKNDKKILRNKSELRIVTGEAEAGKYASLKKYLVDIGGRQYQINASGNTQSNVNINIGKINQSNNQTGSITVEDSRGSIFRRNFTVDVIDYREPQFVYASANRQNNYEEPADLNTTGRTSIIKPGNSNVNEVSYRYRMRKKGSSDYGSWINAGVYRTSTDKNFEISEVRQYIGDYPSDESYDIQVGIKDSFTNWKYTNVSLAEGIALMRLFRDAVAIMANRGALKLVGKDHVYMEFFSHTLDGDRSGYFGYPDTNSVNLILANQKGDGDIDIITSSGQRVRANGHSIDGHIEGRNNPHAVTKNHVGLGDVINYGIATESEVTSSSPPHNKYMTPRRVKQAIEANPEIVERGSNSNGKWIKFKNGTVVATQIFRVTRDNNWRLRSRWTYPVTMPDTPSVTFTVMENNMNSYPTNRDLSIPMIETFLSSALITITTQRGSEREFEAGNQIYVDLQAIAIP